MAKPKGGLTKWFKKEKWVDISAPKKVVVLRSVAEKRQRAVKEDIQSVCRQPRLNQ